MTPPLPAHLSQLLVRPSESNLPLEHLDQAAAPTALAQSLGPEAALVPTRLWNAALYDPLRDFLAEPGKGFRAQLVRLGWTLGGGAVDACPPELIVALEWLHAGSLIVDDIEDGSDTRRGQPALHVARGMPLALNAGNMLYFLAQQQILAAPLPAQIRAELHATVVQALLRCHHGQALDIAAHIDELNQAEVAHVVHATTALKTGSLTALAATLGARAAGATGERLAALEAFGGQLGVSLQMLDDLGSLLSPRRRAKVLEDLRGGHPTWVWAWISEIVDPFTFSRLQSALRLIRAGGPEDALLEELHQRVTHVGRARVAAQLEKTLAIVRQAVGEGAQLDAVHAELERLKRSYV